MMSDTREEHLEKLLSEGLDLCVRARKMDEMDRREATLAVSSDPEEWVSSGMFDKYVEMNNRHRPDQKIASKSITVAVWLQEQYDTDLADWERRSRSFLVHGKVSV